jgi:catechol 2,3-dioxygenase-like lactoylglutathione lyase family enzyme
MTPPGRLSSAYTVTKLPAQDIERARAFYYRDKLGLEPVEARTGGLRYVCGPTEFHLFSSAGRRRGNRPRWHSRSRTSRRPWLTCEPGV